MNCTVCDHPNAPERNYSRKGPLGWSDGLASEPVGVRRVGD
jgi:hypothetical protein